ncbi:MAG: hypothetical protein HFG80_06530 [Eubacterium sp.]|nr:hypothetical protein [Eubacterium sp.]
MIKKCVQKPFFVLVAIIIVLVLGFVSLTKLKTDLMPDMSMPYLIVITTYPGATPEKVENELTKPIESELGTINGIKSVTSSSAENYSMVMLEFEEDTNMDSALVKVNAGLEAVSTQLPDVTGAPNVMEMNLDMMATMYASVSYKGYDIYELTEFVKNTVNPYFERQEGVANVNNIGMVEKTVEVRLSQSKINEINGKVLAKTNEKLGDAQQELDDAKNKLEDSQSEVAQQKQTLGQQKADTSAQLAQTQLQLDQAIATRAAYESQLTSLKAQQSALQAELKAYEDNDVKKNYDEINGAFAQMQKNFGQYAQAAGITIPENITYALEHPKELKAFTDWMAGMGQQEAVSALTEENLSKLAEIVDTRIPQIDTALANLETEIAGVQAMVEAVTAQMNELDSGYTQAAQGSMEASVTFGSAEAQLSAAETAMEDAKSELEDAQKQLDDSTESAVENSNIDELLKLDTLSGIISAQDFAMPAGYIDDAHDNQWMLKVGDELETMEELQSLVLCNIDDIGDVTLADVSEITVIDNAEESYASVNGEEAVVLSVFKGSTSSTNETSKKCKEAIGELETEYEGLKIVPIVDQGDYINMFISTILSSILFGAILAVVVLILFMKDIRPTLVVAFSIPFSVLAAIVLMYFSNISINIMSLSGLSLAIGMLVDNSIVIMENIYRLRWRGMAAPRAAVQGTKQVAAAITSSTLTTICVFLPMIFTTGLVRELMLPMALTITFALVASLVVAMTIVPTMGSVLLKKASPKKFPLFEKIQNLYASVLRFFLKIKIIPLGLALVLLLISAYAILKQGASLFPDMVSDQVTVAVTVPEETSREDAYKYADEIMEDMLPIEGIEMIGAMDSGSENSIMGSMGSSDEITGFSFYVLPKEETKTIRGIKQLCKEIEEKTKDSPCEISVASSAFGDMDQLLGSGLDIRIKGEELDTLLDISQDIEDILADVDAVENISNGQEEADTAIHLAIDKNKAMQNGLTVAQIYAGISDRLKTEADATTMTMEDSTVNVQIVDHTDDLKKENLLDMEFEVDTTDEDGNPEKEKHQLKEFAALEDAVGVASVERQDNERYISVTADLKDGYNITVVSREVEELLKDYKMPKGYSVYFGGETETTGDMVTQMAQMLLIGLVLIYLIMVAQFQSLLSPFIVIFTVPLAFTGGFLGMMIGGERLTLITLIGFLVLMGTIVNNGIVFVDYVNQLRLGGMDKHDALVATGITRMRPILMTALTTILAMCPMIISQDAGNSLSKGMAIVVVGGMLYATLMTLFVVPVMYDILYRRQPRIIDVGDDTIDDAPDDAAEFIAKLKQDGKLVSIEKDQS